MLLYCELDFGSQVVELTWLMKVRVAAAMAIGVVLIGILGWPLAAPADPLGAVRATNLSFSETMILSLLVIAASVIAYFVCWPYGREMAVLAAPSGLAVWAMRSGSMGQLMQGNTALLQREVLWATLKWEPIFWLLVVGVAFAAVWLVQKVQIAGEPAKPRQGRKSNHRNYLNLVIGLLGSGMIALFCITLLARDVGFKDSRLGMVLGQPAIGQIVFSVVVSFGAAAFVVKRFLDVSFIWPTVACALITPFAIITYARQSIALHLVERWPAMFFSNAALSVLPVQMVAFGTLGSIAGYWLAVRYCARREHKTG